MCSLFLIPLHVFSFELSIPENGKPCVQDSCWPPRPAACPGFPPHPTHSKRLQNLVPFPCPRGPCTCSFSFVSRLSLLSAPRAAWGAAPRDVPRAASIPRAGAAGGVLPPAPLSAAAPSWLWLLLGCRREGGRGLCRSPQLVTFLTLLPQDERPAAAEGDGPADCAAAGRDRQRAAGKGLRGGGHREPEHTGVRCQMTATAPGLVVSQGLWWFRPEPGTGQAFPPL